MQFFEYLLKFSIWISATVLFYRLFLSQLTFHTWKRYYLLIYSVIAFFLPFLNISYLLPEQPAASLRVVASIPPVQEYIKVESRNGLMFFLAACCFVVGAITVLAKLLIQYTSFAKIRKSSVLIHQEGAIRIYDTAEAQGAFSFGNDIVVNIANHSDDELRRIMMHEIVHVKQRHTIDLMIAEAVCIVNWFNPFAWMLRHAIRQNLEFIADEKVLSGGINKTEYQLLLLKVTGISQFRVASHFNISDLKNRIAMMNKIKSAKMHLSRFLFAIPVLAVALLAFRTQPLQVPLAHISLLDTVPQKNAEGAPTAEDLANPQPISYNEQGYSLSVVMTNGEPLVLIRERDSKSIVAMTMTEWNKNKSRNEKTYGKLPPPPPAPAPPPVPAAPSAEAAPQAPNDAPPPPPVAPVAPKAPKAPIKKNDDLISLNEDVMVTIEENKVLMQQGEVQLRAAQVKLEDARNVFKDQQKQLKEAQVKFQEMQKDLQKAHQQKSN